MKETRAETPAEIFRNELERNPETLNVSAAIIDGMPAVRFVLGGITIYHWPEDAKRIAAAIIECAEHGRKK